MPRKEPLLLSGTGKQPSLMDLSVLYPRLETKRAQRILEDHLHLDCFTVAKVIDNNQLLEQELSTLSEALNLFLTVSYELTSQESCYLIFKEAILMSHGGKNSHTLTLLTPGITSRPLIVK